MTRVWKAQVCFKRWQPRTVLRSTVVKGLLTHRKLLLWRLIMVPWLLKIQLVRRLTLVYRSMKSLITRRNKTCTKIMKNVRFVSFLSVDTLLGQIWKMRFTKSSRVTLRIIQSQTKCSIIIYHASIATSNRTKLYHIQNSRSRKKNNRFKRSYIYF